MRNQNFTKKKKQKSKRNLKKSKRNLKKSKRNLTNKIGGFSNDINKLPDEFNIDEFNTDKLNDIFRTIILYANTYIYDNLKVPKEINDNVLQFKEKLLYLIPTENELDIKDKEYKEELLKEILNIKNRLQEFLDTKLMENNIIKAFKRVTEEKEQGKMHDYTNSLFPNKIYLIFILCAGIISENEAIIYNIATNIIPKPFLNSARMFKYIYPSTVKNITYFTYFKYIIDIIIYTIIKDIISK